MADSLVGKLGQQIKGQISGFASGMKGAFVSANPALLSPALSGIEKAFQGMLSMSRKNEARARAERGFAEENANEQRKLFTDILGEQKESNEYLKKILGALEKEEKDPWWKQLLAPLLVLGKYLKDGFSRLFDFIKSFKLSDLLGGLKSRIGSWLDELGKFFKDLPAKFSSWFDDIANFFRSIPGKLSSFIDEIVKLIQDVPKKLASFVEGILDFFRTVFPNTTKALSKLLEEIIDIFKLDGFRARIGSAIDEIIATIRTIPTRISSAFDEVVSSIRRLFSTDAFKALKTLGDDLRALPDEIVAKIRSAIIAVRETDLVKNVGLLFDSINVKLASIAESIRTGPIPENVKSLGATVETKLTQIFDAIKNSPITDGVKRISVAMIGLTSGVVEDILTNAKKIVGESRTAKTIAEVAEAVPEKPGFLMSAEERIRARAQYVPPPIEGAVKAEDLTTLQKIRNLIPPGMMKYVDDLGESLGKVFGFVKEVGKSIEEGAKGLGKFLSAITDLDVMIKVIGKFVKALPVIGWVFTTIDGFQAAFDTAGLAKTLGKKAEDVTLADRLKGFIGGFFGSFFGIIDFFEKLITGKEGTMQKDMTAAITKLTDDIAGQLMDFFKFWGGVLTSAPMMAIYKFMGSIGKIAFETIGSSLKAVIELMVGILTFNPEKMMGGIKGLYDTFLKSFKDTFAVIGDFLRAPVVILVNSLIDAFETTINFFIRSFNKLIDLLPGTWADSAKIKEVSLTRMDRNPEETAMREAMAMSYAAAEMGTTISPTPAPMVEPPPQPVPIGPVPPRPDRNYRRDYLLWNKLYGTTHNPDGTPKISDEDDRSDALTGAILGWNPQSIKPLGDVAALSSSTMTDVPIISAVGEILNRVGGNRGTSGQGIPDGTNNKPITTEPTDEERKRREQEFKIQIDQAANDEERIRLEKEQAAANEVRHRELLAAQERQRQATLALEDRYKQQIDAENRRFRQEREALYRQFNQAAKSIYESTIRGAIGNLGVTGSQASMMGGSAIIDKTAGELFSKLGKTLFGKEQGGGMGMIFQKLVGSYANQAVNQILAPAIGIPAPLLNRALNNLAAGNKKEAYADIVFGMTGVPVDTRTFLESVTGKMGIENAISAFSQSLADISTGPMSELFRLAPDGMGMYKVNLQDANQNPQVVASQIAGNNIHAASQLFGQNVVLAGKTMAEIGVLGAKTQADIAEQAAKNNVKMMQGAGAPGIQGIAGALGDVFAESLGIRKTSGTIPGYTQVYGPGFEGPLAPGQMFGPGGAVFRQISPFERLLNTTGQFLGFAGGQAIGKGLGIRQNTLPGMFAQAGVNAVTGNFMNTLFTQGAGAAGGGLLSALGGVYSMLQGGPGASLGNLGMQAVSKMFGAQAVSGTMGQFFTGMSTAGQFGQNVYGYLTGGAGAGGAAPFTTGVEGAAGQMGASEIAGQALGAAATAFATYQLSKALSGGYSAGKAVNYLAAVASFIPGVGMLAAPVAAIINRAFGRKAPVVSGQGLMGTFGSNVQLQNYTDIFEKGGWYRSDKAYTTYSEADQELIKIVGKAIDQSTASIEESAKILSLDSSTFRSFTKDVQIELKGLTAEQQQKALQDAILGYTEDMLLNTYPQIKEYRKEIDGVLESNVEAFRRLATATLQADAAFQVLGYTTEQITDVLGVAITDSATQLAAANVKQQMVDAFGGGDKMQATLQNYLGKVYSPQRLESIKYDMIKGSIQTIIQKDPEKYGRVLDITKYGNLDDAKAAHLTAFEEAMRAGDFETASELATSYDAFIEGVRMSINQKRQAEADILAQDSLTGAPLAFVDEAMAQMGVVDDESQIFEMQATPTTPIISGTMGQIFANEAAISGITSTGVVSAQQYTPTQEFLNEQYGTGKEPPGQIINNNTAVDNSTIVASRPTSITVMRDDNVRDYHPILGASNRGLSGGYGWGNDYQGSFGAG